MKRPDAAPAGRAHVLLRCGADLTRSADLRTIDTGISLRNDHLREKYLEVDKAAGYDKATLSEVDLKGLNPDAPEGKGSFTGSLMIDAALATARVGQAAGVRLG